MRLLKLLIKEETALRVILSSIKQRLVMAAFCAKWRAHNTHNKTRAVNIFPIEKVTVGKETYGDIEVHPFGGTVEGLEIGNYCSLAGKVVFLLGGEHPLDHVSTFPFSRFLFGKNGDPDASTRGRIVVGDDVWIGQDVLVLSGVHIGQGAVIGAKSVVRRDVPPYAIYVGETVKRYRFSEKIISELLKIDYNNLDEKALEYFSSICDEQITENNVEQIVSNIISGLNKR